MSEGCRWEGQRPMWIGGRDVPAAGAAIPVVNPATEEVVGQVPDGGIPAAQAAIDAANEAFPSWKSLPAMQKCELLHEVADRMKERKDALARLLTLEGGKPLKENLDEIGWVIACFDYYAEMGRNYRGRVIPSIEPSQLALVLKEPYGVAVCIVPWNYPLLLMSWKAAPALMAGNTVIIKPSSVTPLSTLALKECFSVLPPGTVNIVTGRGAVMGDHLVESKDTHVIAFTGSVDVGLHIAELAARRAKKVNLELGGKDPFVVCADAPLEVAVQGVAWAAFLNAGQVCTSTERIYVDKKVADRFTESLASYTKGLRLGPGLDPATDIGPMAGASYRDKVERQVAAAVKGGATVLAGGKRPDEFAKGYYYEPTVLVDVRSDMAVMQEETFGPVAPVMAFDDFDEAIAYANGTQYGLGANLYTTDAKKAKKFMEEVKAGTVWINDPLTDNDAGPFGGMKMSGVGRELGEEGLDEFRETKHVHWDFEPRVKEWWYPYGRV